MAPPESGGSAGEAPSTMVVQLQEKHLTGCRPAAMRCATASATAATAPAGLGRANIQYGKKWPTWTPPKEMIARKPEVAKWGERPARRAGKSARRACALHLQGRPDTGFRVHGSPEWWTIGQAMSSGCVRMINQDVIDLYNRVKNGKTPIVVV